MQSRLFKGVELLVMRDLIWLIVEEGLADDGKYNKWGEAAVQQAASRDCLRFQWVRINTIWKMEQC